MLHEKAGKPGTWNRGRSEWGSKLIEQASKNPQELSFKEVRILVLNKQGGRK